MRETISKLVDDKVGELMASAERYCGIREDTDNRLKVLALASSYNDLFGPENKSGDPGLVDLYFVASEKDILAFNLRLQAEIEDKFTKENAPGTINQYIHNLSRDIAVRICKANILKMAVEYSI